MPASPMSFILSHINNNIPEEILNAAFEPGKNQSTLDELIIDKVMVGRVLMDLNLVSGIRTRIPLIDAWKQPVEGLPFEIIVGSTYLADYYLIPPSARENRNIVAVEQIASDYSYTTPNSGGLGNNDGSFGNSVADLASVAISSRTQYNQPIMPQATLMSNNFVKVYPATYSSGLVIECTLEFDRELTNMAQNIIIPTRNLTLCAVKAWIYNKLRIKIDSSEVVAGMSVGAFKDIVLEYQTENAQYDELLMKIRGATLMEPDHLAAIVSMML